MWQQTAKLTILAAASLLATAAGAILLAQEPSGVPSPQNGVVLLRNGQVIEGRVSPAGDYYYVALPSGQLRVKASDVEFVCRDIEEGYRRKRDAIQPEDVLAHLRLAQWCQRHGLLGSAAAELAEAKRADPNHPMITAVQRRLQTALEPAPPAAPTAGEQAVSFEQLDRMVRAMPPGSVETFTQSIQPMLLNNCAAGGCHGLQAEAKLRLMRVPGGAPASRRLTQRNLSEVLQWVDRDHPDQSPLLTVPLEPHGTAKTATIHDRQSIQYKRLVQWVYEVTRRPEVEVPATVLPQKEPQAMAQPSNGFAPVPALSSAAPGESPAGPAKPRGRSAARPQPRREPMVPPAGAPAPPADTPPVPGPDPFDPEVFNRQAHAPLAR